MAIPEMQIAEDALQNVFAERKAYRDQLDIARNEIDAMQRKIDAQQADLEALEPFRSIAMKPLLSMPVYLGDKQVIDMLRGALVKAFGRQYDIGGIEKGDTVAKKIARDKMADFVQACIYDTIKFHYNNTMSRHFPEADFRR